MSLFVANGVQIGSYQKIDSGLFVRQYVIFLCLIWVSPCLHGQSGKSFTISQVLSTYQQDSILHHIQRSQDWADQYNWKSASLRELEIRTETDNFNLRQQEFTFRVSPRNRKEVRYRQYRDQLRTQELQSNRFQRQAIVLEGRYHIIQDIYFSLQQIQHKEHLLLLTREKIRLLALQFGELNLDPVDLAKAETDLFELESDMAHLHLRVQENQDILRSWTGQVDSVHVSFEDFITIPGIRRILLQSSGFHSNHLVDIQLAEQEVEERYLEWQIDRSRDRRWIDFFQARVRGDDMGLVETDFSLGIGFNIPLIKDYKNQNAINELQWRLAKSNLEQLLSEKQSIEHESRSSLLLLIERWEGLSLRINEGLTRQTLLRIRQQEEQDAFMLVQLEEQLYLQQLILFEMEQRIYLSYLQWLQSNGYFSAESPRNYFSQGLEFLN